MTILAIDYGKKKIGLAMASTALAEPYKVMRFETLEKAIREIQNIVEVNGIEKIVIGISEGKTAEETREFANKLAKEVTVPLVFQDETLSTHEAQRLSIEANISRKKRREMEDAYTAAIILQSYLDSI